MPETKNFLIRGMPEELYQLLEEKAQEHRRSKTQEAILALSRGLEQPTIKRVKKPVPFKWGTLISNKFILDAIDEGRE